MIYLSKKKSRKHLNFLIDDENRNFQRKLLLSLKLLMQIIRGHFRETADINGLFRIFNVNACKIYFP